MENTIDSLVSDWLENTSVSDSTKKAYRYLISQWFYYLHSKNINVNSPRRPDLLDYKTLLQQKKYRVATINYRLSVIRQFYQFREAAHGVKNIALGVKNLRKENLIAREPLTAIQVVQLLSNIEKTDIKGLRDFAIINLVARTGLRRCEVERLNINDLSLNPPGLKIRRKGANDKKPFPVHVSITNPIQEYIDARIVENLNEPLFVSHGNRNKDNRLSLVSLSLIVKKNLQKIGLVGDLYTVHSLRHTAAVLAIENGTPIQELSLFLGHSKLITTQVYLKTLNDKLNRNDKALSSIDIALKAAENSLKRQSF